MSASFSFADCLNAGVRVGQRDFPKSVEDPHDLFLIDHNRVGLFKDFFQDRVFVFAS